MPERNGRTSINRSRFLDWVGESVRSALEPERNSVATMTDAELVEHARALSASLPEDEVRELVREVSGR